MRNSCDRRDVGEQSGMTSICCSASGIPCESACFDRDALKADDDRTPGIEFTFDVSYPALGVSIRACDVKKPRTMAESKFDGIHKESADR